MLLVYNKAVCGKEMRVCEHMTELIADILTNIWGSLGNYYGKHDPLPPCGGMLASQGTQSLHQHLPHPSTRGLISSKVSLCS